MTPTKKSSYTTGPWKVSGSYRVKREDGRIIARTDYEHNDENDANALLIAAAPELLEIAQRLMAMPVNLKDVRWEPLIRSCKAAISKAEGRE